MLEKSTILPSTTQKILRVKITTPFNYVKESDELLSEVFEITKVGSYEYTFFEDNQEKNGLTSIYELKGLEETIQSQINQLCSKNQKRALIQDIFRDKKQLEILDIYIPPLIFVPNKQIKINRNIQIVTTTYDPILFEIDVSRFSTNQLTLLIACIFRLINTSSDNYGMFEAVRICSLKILNKTTITKDAKINDESFTYQEISEDILNEEYDLCLKKVKEFL